MAEVVGLIASVATLAEVAIKLQKLISRLRDALGTPERMTRSESGSARLTDVDEYGETALDSAMNEEQYCVCRRLLQVDVDPYHASHFGTSFMEGLLLFYLVDPDTELEDLLYVIITSPEEELQLSEIHKAILQISSNPVLGSILELDSNINATDTYGRTPLWWAAALDDSKSVKTLLEHGADPNIKDTNTGVTALRAAAGLASSCDMLDTLIRYGADTTAVMKQKVSILHQINRNTDLWRNEHHDSVLRLIKYCLNQDHPLDPQDSGGETPLLDAVCYKSHCGADYTISNFYGSGILHAAATYANVAALNILTAHRLPGINIDLKDRGGDTALYIFESRKWKKTQAKIEAFYRLWGEVSMRARGASRTGFVAGVLNEEREIIEGGQQQNENAESAGKEGPEEEDEDDCEDLFVDALEG